MPTEGTGCGPQLISSAFSSLMIFLVISWVLPALTGFVSHNDPPAYDDAVRLPDPVTELLLSATLTAVLCCDILRTGVRARRGARLDRKPVLAPAFNEMIVERAD
ncbi:hypothetical protein Cs7R123_10570 [Catellatospora sp. TT07R-123]|nr:hypothetical protein Cs7R123_10570 [Catellatospora sp. TT07R-123]